MYLNVPGHVRFKHSVIGCNYIYELTFNHAKLLTYFVDAYNNNLLDKNENLFISFYDKCILTDIVSVKIFGTNISFW